MMTKPGLPDEQKYISASDLAAREKAATTEPVAWKCFHCAESFTNVEDARLHFGATERVQPICQIDAKHVRKIEAELSRYREEDTDLHRQIAALESAHALALQREEEKGYERGLRDARPPEHTTADAPNREAGSVGHASSTSAAGVPDVAELIEDCRVSANQFDAGGFTSKRFRKAADALTKQQERIKELEAQVVSGFYEDEKPSFVQGVPTHELQGAVTAEECTGYVNKIEELEAERDGLLADKDATKLFMAGEVRVPVSRLLEAEAERDALQDENEKIKVQRGEAWQAFTRLRKAYSMVRYPTLTEELRLLYDTADAVAAGKKNGENNEQI